MFHKTPVLLSLLCGALLAFAGCSSDSNSSTDTCSGDRCDDPNSTAKRECIEMCNGENNTCFATSRRERALQHCEARKSDALDSAQKAFTKDNIRWACADVEGVNTNGRDDRGQEYCEYFAAVQLPPETEGGALPQPRMTGFCLKVAWLHHIRSTTFDTSTMCMLFGRQTESSANSICKIRKFSRESTIRYRCISYQLMRILVISRAIFLTRSRRPMKSCHCQCSQN